MPTIIQSLRQVERKIYTVPYDDLSDYLKGVRDVINMINGEESSESVADYILDTLEETNFKQAKKEIREKLQNPNLDYIVDGRETKYGYTYQYEVNYKNDNHIVLISVTEGNSTICNLNEIVQMNPEFHMKDEV